MLSYEFIEKLCEIGSLTIKVNHQWAVWFTEKILQAVLVWAYSECCEQNTSSRNPAPQSTINDYVAHSGNEQ